MAKKDAPAVKYGSLALLNKAVDSVLRASGKMDTELQAIGLSALAHLDQHGDIGPINRLLLGLGAGTRKSSLAQWFLNWGSLKKNEEKETKAEKPFVYDRSRKTDMAGAAEQHWTVAQKPRDISDVFDVHAALARLIKQAKAKKNTDPNLVAALEAIAPIDVQNAAK